MTLVLTCFPPNVHRALPVLSGRESQVYAGLAVGQELMQISRNLSLNGSTVSTYRERILIKLGLRNNAELVVSAYMKGLLKAQEIKI